MISFRIAAVLAAVSATLVVASPARAVSPPVWTTSHYVTPGMVASDFYDIGHKLGSKVAGGTAPAHSTVIFDFGAQNKVGDTWYAQLPATTTLRGKSAVQHDIEQFGKGFAAGTGALTSPTVNVALGTNNGIDRGPSAGTVWANWVDGVNSWLRSTGFGDPAYTFSDQVTAYGANDYEIGFCGGHADCASDARDWSDSYDAASTSMYYNYGDCAGCRTSSAHPGDNQTGLGDGWTLRTVWYVSWGNGPALATPEIYRTDGKQASQWEQVAEYGWNSNCATCGRLLAFTGSLSQAAACNGGCGSTGNTPGEAWSQLWRALNTTADYNGHVAPSYLAQRPGRSLNIDWG